jgi:fructuronate reductase
LTDLEPERRLCAGHPTVRLSYDRSKVTPGIVHLGIGAFHRAHMATYVDDILHRDPSWGIIGVSLRRPDTRDALAPQDSLYTLLTRSAAGTAARVIGSVLAVLDATTQRAEVIAAMTDPRTRIVSLTVTEKGYCHDPATGEIDPCHPDVLHDLVAPSQPVSAPGMIVRALELRRLAGIAPFTVLCCDNLPENGKTVRRIVVGLAAMRDKALAGYIADTVFFPSTMVDRIVPATTEEDRRLAFDLTGAHDAWPVITEPFTQWVVEDQFSAGRPPLELAGAELVVDVRPFELMKLRMLNGSHSTIAYLGYLGGYTYVAEAIADPALLALIHGLLTDEVMSTLPQDLHALGVYRDALLERFRNPALKHQIWQIAMDGSQKLPQRLLGTIRDRLATGRPATRASLGVAAWMRYVSGRDELGREIDVKDPLARRLRQIATAAQDSPAQLADGLLNVTEVFGDDLPRHAAFRAEIVRHLASLFRCGALETVRGAV